MRLATVCEEAQCPTLKEWWNSNVMVMGEIAQEAVAFAPLPQEKGFSDQKSLKI